MNPDYEPCLDAWGKYVLEERATADIEHMVEQLNEMKLLMSVHRNWPELCPCMECGVWRQIRKEETFRISVNGCTPVL